MYQVGGRRTLIHIHLNILYDHLQYAVPPKHFKMRLKLHVLMIYVNGKVKYVFFSRVKMVKTVILRQRSNFP